MLCAHQELLLTDPFLLFTRFTQWLCRDADERYPVHMQMDEKEKNWWRKGKHTWDLLVHKTSSYHVIDQFQWMFRERNYFRFFWTIVSDVSLAVAFRRKNDVNVHIKCVLSLTFCINQFTVHNQILRKRQQKAYKFFSRLMGARVRPELLFYVVSIIPLCIVHHISRCYTFSLFSGWPMMCHWMRLIRAIIHTK